tara:strand:- start:1953 stop:2687 length:735 start_codon:yes stop_codon:yes gene_type:complete
VSDLSCVLDVTDLWKSYGHGEVRVDAVRGVSLKLKTGEFMALVGPSGCGKSTLLHLCGAMDRPTKGHVSLEGLALDACDETTLTKVRRSRVGFVFQFFNLLPTLTVEQNIALPLLLEDQNRSDVSVEVERLVRRVGLQKRTSHFPQQLSGGEAQRAAIARAVIHRPVLLIADEPTGNLDSENGSIILDILLELNTQLGTAIMLATHDDRVAEKADRIISIRDGEVVGDVVQCSGRAQIERGRRE